MCGAAGASLDDSCCMFGGWCGWLRLAACGGVSQELKTDSPAARLAR